MKVSDVVFRDDLYPRIETSATTVQKYAEDLSVLPPIEVNQKNELIDGWHRWTAHKKSGAETIKETVTETESDEELIELAIIRNSAFGYQLATSDKKAMARRIYRATSASERGTKKKRLAEILSMSEATIDRWLKRIDKDTEEERNAAVLNLWLQCYTQEEIADATGVSRDKVNDLLCQIRKCEISTIPGMFTEDQPEDSAAEKVKKAWEADRQVKIVEHNEANAHSILKGTFNEIQTQAVTSRHGSRRVH